MGKSVVIIGHRECHFFPEEKVISQIQFLLDNGYDTFYSGGMGEFDLKCARILVHIKQTCPNLQSHLVIPFLSFKIPSSDLYDEIIFPAECDKLSPRFAIPRRNRWMVDQSQAALCFVLYSWGGAATTLQYAQKKNLHIFSTT